MRLSVPLNQNPGLGALETLCVGPWAFSLCRFVRIPCAQSLCVLPCATLACARKGGGPTRQRHKVLIKTGRHMFSLRMTKWPPHIFERVLRPGHFVGCGPKFVVAMARPGHGRGMAMARQWPWPGHCDGHFLQHCVGHVQPWLASTTEPKLCFA